MTVCSAPGSDVMSQLRAATAMAHARLEHDLDLLRPPMLRSRFTRLLERFWSFHLAWEPAIHRHAVLDPVRPPCLRLEALRLDLAALGLSAAYIERLPRCDPAERLTDSPEAALGSLYVLEGSALGGRLITRALQACDWLPAEGLRYFDLYGAEGGVVWRRLQDHLRSVVSPAMVPAVQQGALATFELLREVLTRP